MFTNSYQLFLKNSFLYLLRIFLYATFLYSSIRHSFWQQFEVEIRNISFESLKKWILSKVSIEFVSSRLALKKNVVTMLLKLFLNFHRNSVRKNAFSCTKLHIDEIRCYKLTFKSFVCNHFCL